MHVGGSNLLFQTFFEFQLSKHIGGVHYTLKISSQVNPGRVDNTGRIYIKQSANRKERKAALTWHELLYLHSIRTFVAVINYWVCYSGQVTHVASSPPTFRSEHTNSKRHCLLQEMWVNINNIPIHNLCLYPDQILTALSHWSSRRLGSSGWTDTSQRAVETITDTQFYAERHRNLKIIQQHRRVEATVCLHHSVFT